MSQCWLRKLTLPWTNVHLAAPKSSPWWSNHRVSMVPSRKTIVWTRFVEGVFLWRASPSHGCRQLKSHSNFASSLAPTDRQMEQMGRGMSARIHHCPGLPILSNCDKVLRWARMFDIFVLMVVMTFQWSFRVFSLTTCLHVHLRSVVHPCRVGRLMMGQFQLTWNRLGKWPDHTR